MSLESDSAKKDSGSHYKHSNYKDFAKKFVSFFKIFSVIYGIVYLCICSKLDVNNIVTLSNYGRIKLMCFEVMAGIGLLYIIFCKTKNNEDNYFWMVISVWMFMFFLLIFRGLVN